LAQCGGEPGFQIVAISPATVAETTPRIKRTTLNVRSQVQLTPPQ
jgi:hypothetical protein